MIRLPPVAAWRHLGARVGFEALFPLRQQDGYLLEGHATAVEGEEAWAVRYTLSLDAGWATRSAQVVARSAAGAHEARLEADGAGGWRVDGEPAPALAGCRDVDLEASAFTNALTVNRLRLDVGREAEAPAAWVRAPDLRVERLEQRYARLPDEDGRARYSYAAPDLEFETVLVCDRLGLVLDYPGLAVREL